MCLLTIFSIYLKMHIPYFMKWWYDIEAHIYGPEGAILSTVVLRSKWKEVDNITDEWISLTTLISSKMGRGGGERCAPGSVQALKSEVALLNQTSPFIDPFPFIQSDNICNNFLWKLLFTICDFTRVLAKLLPKLNI